MKTLLAVIALALVCFAPSSASAAPIKVGEHYDFIESSYVEYAHDYTLLGTEWYWNGNLIIIEHWMAYLYSHSWGVRQLVEDWYDDETFEEWQVYLTPEGYDFTSDDPIYWDEVYGDGGGGGEQAVASEELDGD